MTHGHSFWFYLVGACIAWYTTVTIYVSVRGVIDIRDMLRGLRDRGARADSQNSTKEVK
jgi:hypothetical protein